MSDRTPTTIYLDCMGDDAATTAAKGEIRPLHAEAAELGKRFTTATADETNRLKRAVTKMGEYSANDDGATRDREAALWTAAHRTLPKVAAARAQADELAASLIAAHTEELAALERTLQAVIARAKERITELDRPTLTQLYKQSGGASIEPADPEPGEISFRVSSKMVANPTVSDQTQLPAEWLMPDMKTIRKELGTSGEKIRQAPGVEDDPQIRLRISAKSGERPE